MVFGTFDGLHAGHQYFLRSAKTIADELIVGVARDEHVRQLKHKEPQQTQQERLDAVARLSYVDQAVLCDQQLGSFALVSSIKPDLILLGHDQQDLAQALEEWFRHTTEQIPMKWIDELSFETCANCTCQHD